MPTLKQIQAKLKRLQSQTEALIAERAQAVLDDIRALMERHGLTTDDLRTRRARGKRAAKTHVTLPAPAGRRESMKTLATKGKLPAKYRNPKTGETWSGWARPPAWIANVKDRSKFLIDADGQERPVKARKTAAKKSTTRVAKAKKTAGTTKPSVKRKRAASPAPADVAEANAPAAASAKEASPSA